MCVWAMEEEMQHAIELLLVLAACQPKSKMQANIVDYSLERIDVLLVHNYLNFVNS